MLGEKGFYQTPDTTYHLPIIKMKISGLLESLDLYVFTGLIGYLVELPVENSYELKENNKYELN